MMNQCQEPNEKLGRNSLEEDKVKADTKVESLFKENLFSDL
jgi:hypothetical protein